MTKVVSPDEVVFDPGSARPDALQGQENTSQSPVAETLSTSKGMEAMAECAPLFFHETYQGSETLKNPIRECASLFPLVVQIKKVPGNNLASIDIDTCLVSTLRTFLETKYGPEIAQTGIYEAVGLSGPATDAVDISSLPEYFPEVNELLRINGHFIQIIYNPFQPLFALPIMHRPFFADLTLKRHATEKGNSNASNRFRKDLTLQHILEHAKEVGEVSKVREYLDAYNKIWETP